MMLDDEDYNESIENIIDTQSVNAEYAVAVTSDNFAQMFSSMDDAYMQARAADVRDISNRIIANLTGNIQDSEKSGAKIILFTDTINNLYDMLGNYEIDLAVVDGSFSDPRYNSMLLDTDCLMCIMATDNPLAKKGIVTLSDLKKQKMILRTPSSSTRKLFDSTLESNNVSVGDFNIMLEVDNIATIKDLIRKNLGVSILPGSACMDEIKKGKITALPIENLSMVRETKIIYNKDFANTDLLSDIIKTYRSLGIKQSNPARF